MGIINTYTLKANMKHTEHTANLALATAPRIKVGANFAKPIPRLQTPKKELSYLQRLVKFGRKA